VAMGVEPARDVDRTDEAMPRQLHAEAVPTPRDTDRVRTGQATRWHARLHLKVVAR
jgi:hypothetical protein